MSKFIELSGDDPLEGDLTTTVGSNKNKVRAPATTDFTADDDNVSLEAQDIELGDVNGGGKANIKGFIKQKKAQISNFNAGNYIETKKQQMQAFSLEEFMSDKRKVVRLH